MMQKKNKIMLAIDMQYHSAGECFDRIFQT